MSNLTKFLEAIDYDNTPELGWDCFPGGRFYSTYNHERRVEVHAIIEPRTDVIYQVDVVLGSYPVGYTKHRAWRWTNPEYHEAYKSFMQEKGQTPHVHGSLDDPMALTDALDDILAKATAALTGGEFDTRVVMEFDLDKDVHATLMAQAAGAGKSFDDYVAEILIAEIAKLESEDNKGSA